MKLARVHIPGERARAAFVKADGSCVCVAVEVAPPEREAWLSSRALAELISVAEQDADSRRFAYKQLDRQPTRDQPHLLIPIEPPEVWGAGVTYRRSAEMRDEDSGTDIYDYAYSKPRPELFFKATASRCVGPNAYINIRTDSQRTAAEPELAVVLGQGAEIVGYTLCNDVSAWDIERENPLYLPQSKIYQGCCALGPVLVTADEIPDPAKLNLTCRIIRDGKVAFQETCSVGRMKRTIPELVEYLTRHNPVPPGTVLSTGTGIITPEEFMLREEDVVEIEVPEVGVLRNPVRRLAG